MTDLPRSQTVSAALDTFWDNNKPAPLNAPPQKSQAPRVPDVVLARIDRSFGEKKEELRVALCEFEGKTYAGLRVIWRGREGEWLPGKAGITIRAKEIREVIAALQNIANEIAK